jgi:hypothetical protein
LSFRFGFKLVELFCFQGYPSFVEDIIAYNVLQLPEGGDFKALHCQPSTNFDRSTKLDLTTEPPLLGRCCYGLFFFIFLSSVAAISFKSSIHSCSLK